MGGELYLLLFVIGEKQRARGRSEGGRYLRERLLRLQETEVNTHQRQLADTKVGMFHIVKAANSTII